MNYCEKCMQPLAGRTICPDCGSLPPAPVHHVRPGSVLQEKYLVGRALSEDDGSITYLGRDLSEQTVVVLREFYPAELASRDHNESNVIASTQPLDGAVNRFAEKARLLSEFRNEPCLAGVLDCFRQNHTAYMVMERPGGLSMQTFVWKKGPVPAAGLLELMKPMLRTLHQIHRKGLIHRNISPESLRIYGDGSMKLVGFGSVHGAMDENSLKPGYAPVELYGLHSSCGPWSDVYALCASIYTCITGVVPQLSAERAAHDQLLRPSHYGAVLTQQQEDAIMRGLSVWPQGRIASVEELMRELDLAELVPQPEFVPQPAEPQPAEPQPVEPQAEKPQPAEPQAEKPQPAAPRWEPVDDPATWKGMPEPFDVPNFLDPVSMQGRANAEPAVSVTPQPEEPAVAAWKPEPVEEPKPAQPIPWEEPAPEWQGDYSPVEPIDPKFWQKELGIKEPAEPFPWEETPGAWQEPPGAQSEEPEIWPGIPEQEEQPADPVPQPQSHDTPERPRPERRQAKGLKITKKRLLIALGAAVVVIAAVIALILLLPGKNAESDAPVELSFQVGGTAYELPCLVADLNEDGWLPSRLQPDTMIAGGNVLLIDLEKEGSMKVSVTNTGEGQAPLSQCAVTGLTVSDPAVELDVSGIDLQTTMEEVKQLLGKPNEKTDDSAVYVDAEGFIWTFKEKEDGTLNSIGVAAKTE